MFDDEHVFLMAAADDDSGENPLPKESYYIVQPDGFRITLADGSGYLLKADAP